MQTRPVFSETGADEPFAQFLKEPSDLTVEELYQRVSGAYNQGYLDALSSRREVLVNAVDAFNTASRALSFVMSESANAFRKLVNESD